MKPRGLGPIDPCFDQCVLWKKKDKTVRVQIFNKPFISYLEVNQKPFWNIFFFPPELRTG